MARLTLSFLGTFLVTLDERLLTHFRSDKVKSLLAYLAIEAGQPHLRTKLSTLFWPDEPDSVARQNLRQSLYQLRQLLGEQVDQSPPFLLITRDTVQWNPAAAATLDVAAFLTHLEQHELAEAVALYRGDLLMGLTCDSVPFEEWLLFTRERYHHLALDALFELTEEALVGADYARARTYAQRQLALEPWREEAHRQLMLALACSGERSAALAHYEVCCRVLEAELGAEPEAATVALHEQIRLGQLKGVVRDRQGHSHPVAEPAVEPAALRQPSPALGSAAQPLFLHSGAGVQSPRPPFVGRVHELARLEEALAQAYAGQGQLRFLVGGAGRGKTALVQELARRAQDGDANLLVVSGYCSAHTGAGDPYLPFREALNMLAGDVESSWAGGLVTTPHARRLWEALPVTLPALAEYALDLIGPFTPAQPFIARAAAFAPPDTAWLQAVARRLDEPVRALDEKILMTQFVAALRAIASQRPLLLILEDLHWIDAASSNLLFHLSRTLAGSPLLLLGTYRPDELTTKAGETRHPLAAIAGELKRQHGDIWLDLDEPHPESGRAFVDAYLDTQPNRLGPSFRKAFYLQTEGHALFTVELLRTLQERGDLRQDERGRWVASDAIDWQTLPARVEGVIEQRIRRLDEATQTLLTVASVEGEFFTAEVVARIQGMEERPLVQQLGRELDQQHRLVMAQTVAWLGPQRLSRYRFRHILFQQYLYQQIDAVERSYLHDAVATTLESIYDGETQTLAVQLAWHFAQAGRLDKAAQYLLQAGNQAYWLSAYQEAATHFSKGLALLTTLPPSAQQAQQELELQIAYGNALMATQGWGAPELEAVYTRARQLCGQLANHERLGPVLHGLVLFHSVRAEYAQSQELAQEVLALAQTQADEELLLTAYSQLGLNCLFLGGLVESRMYLEQALSLQTPQQRRHSAFRFGMDPYVASLGFLAASLWLLGYPDQALQRSNEAVALTKQLAHPFSLAFALVWQANLYHFRRQDQRAQAPAEELILLVQQYGFPVWSAAAKGCEGWLMVVQGEVAAGIERIAEGFADWMATNQTLAQTFYVGMLAEAYAAQHDVEGSLQFIDMALALAEQTGERFWTAELYRRKGELLWQQASSGADVEACFVQAIAIARQQQAKSLELRATTNLCRLWQSQDNRAQAYEWLVEIYGWFTEGFDTPDLLEARALLNELSALRHNR
jgi:DNA-binding SARP family transcriptional activator/predicted ATPase